MKDKEMEQKKYTISINVNDSVVMGNVNINVTGNENEVQKTPEELEIYAEDCKEFLYAADREAQKKINPRTNESFVCYMEMIMEMGSLDEVDRFFEMEEIALEHTDYKPRGMEKRMEILDELANSLGHKSIFDHYLHVGAQESYDYYKRLLERAKN